MSEVRNLNEGMLKHAGVRVDPGRGFVVVGLSSGGSVAAVLGSIPDAVSAGLEDFAGLSPLQNPITGIFSGLPFLVTAAMIPSEYRDVFRSRDMAFEHKAIIEAMRHVSSARVLTDESTSEAKRKFSTMGKSEFGRLLRGHIGPSNSYNGNSIPNPTYDVNQQRVDTVEATKAEFESRVKQAEEHESDVFAITSRAQPCIGGQLVFVDLAGADFLSGIAGGALKRSPQEKQQGRQINTDLLALKEVIRARSLGQPRIPYRSSPLTYVRISKHRAMNLNRQSSSLFRRGQINMQPQ